MKLQPFVLTPEEEKICATLMATNQRFNLGTTFRWAGGIVRDKLLGIPSDDIDICLNTMTGKKFSEFLFQMGSQFGVSGKSYVVDLNAEKSKHLETCAVEIWGRKIDFVNLRSEKYGDSRIPEVSIGTPEQDAQRRDLTVNSLMFNINSGEIEDFTNGIKDLENMILRTPLESRRTFLDDPLRILRVCRFFSRFENATLDPSILQAMADPEVHEAFRQKVSSERSGPEITKLLAGARPAESLRILFDTGMDKAVFNVPKMRELNDLNMSQRNDHHKHSVLDHTLLVVKNLHELLKQENADADLRVKMLMAATFHDIGKCHPDIGKPKEKDPTQFSYIGHEDKSAEIAHEIMRSIGIPEQDRRFVARVVSLHMRPHTEEWTPKMIGRFLRDCQIPGQENAEVWKHVMLHAIADTLSKDSANPDVEDAKKKRQHMQMMQDFMTEKGRSVTKPVLNGLEVMTLFPTLKPSSGFIKEVSEKLLDAQATGVVVDQKTAEKFIQNMRAYIEEKFKAD